MPLDPGGPTCQHVPSTILNSKQTFTEHWFPFLTWDAFPGPTGGQGLQEGGWGGRSEPLSALHGFTTTPGVKDRSLHTLSLMFSSQGNKAFLVGHRRALLHPSHAFSRQTEEPVICALSPWKGKATKGPFIHLALTCSLVCGWGGLV